MILRVGLTGGIASGKSTIVRMLAGLGCITVDADEIVAKLYREGQAGHAAIVETYGKEILQADGEIDRRKLANIAFSKPEEAQKLNALIHPLVIAEQARLFREAEERGVIDLAPTAFAWLGIPVKPEWKWQGRPMGLAPALPAPEPGLPQEAPKGDLARGTAQGTTGRQ